MNETANIVECIESLGYEVMNWKPGTRRIYKVLNTGHEVSLGMYASELRAWFRGLLQGLKNNQPVVKS